MLKSMTVSSTADRSMLVKVKYLPHTTYNPARFKAIKSGGVSATVSKHGEDDRVKLACDPQDSDMVRGAARAVAKLLEKITHPKEPDRAAQVEYLGEFGNEWFFSVRH